MTARVIAMPRHAAAGFGLELLADMRHRRGRESAGHPPAEWRGWARSARERPEARRAGSAKIQ